MNLRTKSQKKTYRQVPKIGKISKLFIKYLICDFCGKNTRVGVVKEASESIQGLCEYCNESLSNKLDLIHPGDYDIYVEDISEEYNKWSSRLLRNSRTSYEKKKLDKEKAIKLLADKKRYKENRDIKMRYSSNRRRKHWSECN